jgi:hypothetical protein
VFDAYNARVCRCLGSNVGRKAGARAGFDAGVGRADVQTLKRQVLSTPTSSDWTPREQAGVAAVPSEKRSREMGHQWRGMRQASRGIERVFGIRKRTRGMGC